MMQKMHLDKKPKRIDWQSISFLVAAFPGLIDACGERFQK
jgi:hypothetical protein